MTQPRHARLWFRFRGTSGQTWTVLLVTPTLMAIGGLLLSWETTAHGTVRNFAVEPRLYFENETVHQIDAGPEAISA